MKVREIAAAIEAFAPLGTQESWDNAGLCIGSPDAEVRAVLVGFDCTPALVREAVERGADMIVTHHPLIFGGLRRIDPDDPVGAAVYLAIRHGIAVYAAHTNADKAVGGVNTLMAERLADIVRSLDDSRPITSGCNEPNPNNHLFKGNAMDIIGYNYHNHHVGSSRYRIVGIGR